MMRTKNGRPRCTAHLWSVFFDVTISGNDLVQSNVTYCAWTGRGGVILDLSPLLPHPLWLSLRPVKLINMFRCGWIFPHLRPARWTRSIPWKGNPNRDRDIKQLVIYGACKKQPAVQQALVQTVPEEEFSQILTNLSVIASVECDLGILATCVNVAKSDTLHFLALKGV